MSIGCCLDNPSSSSGGGGAPSNATYITLTNNPGLTNNRTLAVDSSLTITDDGATMPVILGINTAHSNHWTAPQYIGRDASTGSMLFPTEAVVAEGTGATSLGIYSNNSSIASTNVTSLFMGEAKTSGFNGFPQVQIETHTDSGGSTGNQFFNMSFIGRDSSGAIISSTPFMNAQIGNVTGLQPVVFPGGLVISDFDFASGTMQLTDSNPLTMTPQVVFFGNNAPITIGSTAGLSVINSNVYITCASDTGGSGFNNTAGNTYIGVALDGSGNPGGDGIAANTIVGGGLDIGQTGSIGWTGNANALIDSGGEAEFVSVAADTGSIPNLSVNSMSSSTGSLTLSIADFKILTVGKTLYIKQGLGGMFGDVTLTSGVGTVTISGLTTNDRAFVQLTVTGGTIGTGGHKAVCTANTLTVTSVMGSGSTQTLDTSTLTYFIIRPA